MAATLDAVSGVEAWDDTEHSFSFTCSGSERLLVVVATNRTSSGYASSMTYNSVSLSSIVQINGDGNNPEIWYLINPDTGSNTLYIDSQNTDCGAVAICYNNIDQTTPLDANAGDEYRNTQNVSLPITTGVNNALIVTTVTDAGDGIDHTAGGTGHVEIADGDTGSGAGQRRISVGHVLDAGSSGAKTPTWDTGNSGADGGWAAASFQATAGGGGAVLASMKQLVGHGVGTRS